jgi:hypothetical protein
MSLYKYVVPERIDILRHARIRVTQAAALNDPFELKPHFEIFAEDEPMRQIFLADAELSEGFETAYSMASEIIDEIGKLFPSEDAKKELDEIKRNIPPPDVLRQQAKEEYPAVVEELVKISKGYTPYLRNALFAKYSEVIGVLSLTEKYDNLLMWAHYANNYKGFVIEFDEKHEFFNPQRFPAESFGGLRKVEYSDIRPTNRSLMEMTPKDIFLIKSKEWEYEQEWRMLAHLEDSNDLILKVDGKAILDPEGLPIYLGPIPPSCITGIIFGSRMTDENKATISNILSSDKRYSHVKKRWSVLDEKTFKLNTIP